MYLSVLFLFFFLVTGASTGTAQAAGPAAAAAPSIAAETEAEVGLAQPFPIDSVVELDATVVRTSRSGSAGGAPSGDLLVRVGTGDTLRVRAVSPLPGVGASVRLRGRIVGEGGAVAMVGEVGTIQPTVLRPGTIWEPDARALLVDRCAEPEGAARARCAIESLPPWLLALAGATLLAALGALWAGFRPGAADGDGADIPLIVDLGAARAPTGSTESTASTGTGRAAAPAVPGPEPAGAPHRGGPPQAVATAAEPATDRSGPSERQQQDERLPATAHHPPFIHIAGIANVGVAGAVTRPDQASPANGLPSAPAGSASGPAAPAVSVDENARLQLLPGVFEVEDGPGLGPELRFFRVTSMEDAVITLGRDEGEPYRHVRLDAPTVSRLHARIRFADRSWTIANLSAMNPVVVNGEELGAEEDALVLGDGDRIRIGEFVFRYRDARRR